MGIKNLHKFLRATCPQVFQQVHLSNYAFKKVAIDISLYMCKFKTIYGEYWLSSFIKLISCLRRNEIHCVFIYDTGSPPEKESERKERAAQRERLREKVCVYEHALEQARLTGEVDQILVDLYHKKKTHSSKRLLGNDPIETINFDIVEDAVRRMRNQVLVITEKDYNLTRELFDILKVPYYNAPLEAETMCADLCKRGIVDAVLSEDSDVIAYGAPNFLNKIDMMEDTCMLVEHSHVLESLDLTYDEFLDFCIMCGTDYNKNIFRVGCMTAYKRIVEHRSIENIDKYTQLDVCVLNHQRVRELFTGYEKMDIKIPYCGKPDFNKLQEFIFKHNIRMSIDGLRKDFIRDVVFE